LAVGPGDHLVAGYDTTVGDVRATPGGLGQRTAASFASGLPGAAAAAWCYLDSADGTTRRVVARAESGEQITFVTGNPQGLPPSSDGPRVP
jgi:hypothetical protein